MRWLSRSGAFQALTVDESRRREHPEEALKKRLSLGSSKRWALMIVVVGLAFFCGVCGANEPSRSDRILQALNDSSSDVVLIAAHRGGYANDREDGAPENSVANIAVAVRKGFDLYETDIRRTKDGVFVIVHDATLERETNGTGAVEGKTLAEVKELRKRYRDGSLSDERVATLEEFLIAGKDQILFKADLKPGVVEHFDALARLIDKHGMNERVILRASQRNAESIAACFATGTPKVEVMFKVVGVAGVKDIAKRFSPSTIQINVEKGEALSDKQRVAIRAAIDLGMLVQTHSYGDAAQSAELVEAGVRMFHTAKPDATLAYLNKQGMRPRKAATKP